MKPRPHKSKPKSPNGAKHPPSGLKNSGPVSTQTNPFRKWLFRALAGITIPLLALGILEAALRLGGYGYPTNFFRPMQIGGQEFLVQNDSFGFRFFPA
ncbi:MAG: hypothetical protein WDM80_03430 [Limisphaerales bacterium]